jgi:RHS repeat-associated protein
MTKGSTLRKNHTAAGPAAGYFFQPEVALKMLTEADAEASIAIEADDDITERIAQRVTQRSQLKHQTVPHGAFTDSSVDLWKTLSIWTTAAHAKEFNTKICKLVLVTNGTVSDCFIRKTVDAKAKERKLLIDTALDKKYAATVEPYVEIVRQHDRKLVYSVFACIGISDARALAGKSVKSRAISNLHLSDSIDPEIIYDGLLGWIHKTTIDLWRNQQLAWISKKSFSNQYQAMIRRYNRSSYTVGSNNQITSDGTYDYEYDDEGNRTKKTNSSTNSYTTYVWDYRNRLTSVKEYNNSNVLLEETTYAYDANNRLVKSTFDAGGAGGGSATVRYWIFDSGINPVLEFDGSSASDVSHRYLWGPVVDQLFADEQPTSTGSAGNVLWGLSDNLGTLRDIGDLSGSTTSVTNHRRFGSYGNLVSESNSAVDMLFAFTGKLYDENVELQNNLNRWYDAAIGQWMSEDPIGFDAGDPNLRRYVGNRVASRTDRLGMMMDPSQEPNTDNLSKDEPSRPIGTPNEPSSPSAGTIFEEIGGKELKELAINEALEWIGAGRPVQPFPIRPLVDLYDDPILPRWRAPVPPRNPWRPDIRLPFGGGLSPAPGNVFPFDERLPNGRYLKGEIEIIFEWRR